MNKILKAFKCGGSVVLPLTDFINLNDEYLVYTNDDKIVIEKFKK